MERLPRELEVDWKQDRPSEAAIESSWRSVNIRPLEGTSEPVEEYLTQRFVIDRRFQAVSLFASTDTD
jgi:hypothetical protein